MRVELPTRSLHIEAEVHGDAAAPTVIMVMGLGLQLLAWPDELLGALRDKGYRVVVFDNRDCGLSGARLTEGHSTPQHAILAHLLRRPFVPAYRLGDMAEDTLALADALQIGRFHLVGVSLGGMIAQTLAARAPERVLNLASLMSSAGPDTAPWPNARVLWRMLRRPPVRAGHGARVEHMVRLLGMLGRLRDAEEIGMLRRRVDAAIRRAYRPGGVARQLMAVLADRDRSAEVARIACPTLILHGRDDPLVKLPAAHHLKRMVPHARLHVVERLGHYLPQRALPEIGSVLIEHLRGAELR
ncbi:MAG TPA: alpha/beta hydrolase [Xanthomonadaceae bacterium]|nr:alpha/beta hydrolase [Xanthomonadaceae bacterium]